jgi:hypothetical protein
MVTDWRISNRAMEAAAAAHSVRLQASKVQVLGAYCCFVVVLAQMVPLLDCSLAC